MLGQELRLVESQEAELERWDNPGINLYQLITSFVDS
jgi:hypothetical protein